MSDWLQDLSANRIKNSYITDSNNKNFALDVSGNIIVRGDSHINFENQIAGTYIGTDISTNLLDGSSNIIIGNDATFERLKQWNVVSYGSNTDLSLNGVVFGDNKFVAVGNDSKIIYSIDNGYNWINIPLGSFDFDNEDIGMNKITFTSSSNFAFNEVQVWLDNNNLLDETGTTITQSSLSDNDFLTETTPVTNYEIDFSGTTTQTYKIKLLQSIVVYARNTYDVSGVTMKIFDDESNIVFEKLIDENKEYYRFDGNGNVLDNMKSGADSETKIIYSDVSFNFNKIKLSKPGGTFSITRFQLVADSPISTSSDFTFNKVRVQLPSGYLIKNSAEDIDIFDNTTDGAGNGKIISFTRDDPTNSIFAIISSDILYSNLAAIIISDLVTNGDVNYPPSAKLQFIKDSTIMKEIDFSFDSPSENATAINNNQFRFNGPYFNTNATQAANLNTNYASPNYKVVDLGISGVENIIDYGTSDYLNNVTATQWTGSEITLDLSSSVSNFDFDSFTIYAGNSYGSGTYFSDNGMQDVIVEFLYDTTSVYKYKLYDITNPTNPNDTNYRIYRFDGANVNSSLFVTEASTGSSNFDEFVSVYGQNNVVNDPNYVKVISTIPVIKTYNVNASTPGLLKDLNGIAYDPNNNKFVAVGDKIILSASGEDLTNWTGVSFKPQNTIYNNAGESFAGNNQNFSAIAYGDNKFVAIALNQNPLYSNDGVRWNSYGIILNSGNELAIAYGDVPVGNQGPTFVVVKNDTTFNISNALQDVIIWGDSIDVGLEIGVAYGANKFVVIDSENKIQYNETGGNGGTAWTSVTINDASWSNLRFLNNQFLGIANDGVKRLVYSDDGITWYPLRIEASSWSDIAFGNNNYIIVGNGLGSDNGNRILINDGKVDDAIVIGNSSRAEYHNSIAIGRNTMAENENQIIIGDTTCFIGIRKNDPVFTLDVNGDINFKGRLLQGGVEISSDDAGQASGTVINAKIVRNKYDEEGLWLGYGNNGSGNNNGDIRFYANNLTERMRIKADTGNVGINATSPRCILDISGSDALVVPVGNTSQRPNYDENNVESSGIVGAIRYNIELDQYEGYGTPFNTAETLTGGYWGSLGGVKDIDRDTFITAEETLDEDKLKFYTSGVQRMVIDPSGNFGIGVTDPSSVLHIFDNSNNSAIFLGETIDNNKSVKIEYTQGDTDVTGNLLLSHSGDSNGLNINKGGNVGIGVTDASAGLHLYQNSSYSEIYLGEAAASDKCGIVKYLQGNGNGTGKLQLGNWGDNTNTDGMTIEKGGNVGIGTDNPSDSSKLYVNGNIKTPNAVFFDGQGTNYIGVGNGDAASSSTANVEFKIWWGLRFLDHAGTCRTFLNTRSGQLTSSSFNATSDIRLKKDISNLTNVLDDVCKLQGIEFVRRDDETGKKQLGFIAQDVEEIFPQLVDTENSEEEYKSVAYANTCALLVEAIKELRQEVKDLKEEIRELKSI